MEGRSLLLCFSVAILHALPLQSSISTVAGPAIRLDPGTSQGVLPADTGIVQDLKKNFGFNQCLSNLATLDFTEISEEQRATWPRGGDQTGLDKLPPETTILIGNHQRFDRTRRTVFVSADAGKFYIADRGGITDQINWYGPIKKESLLAACRMTM